MSNGNLPPNGDPIKLAPHSVEAEEAVLGAILIDPMALYDVLPFLKAEDFFIVRNMWVYDALLNLNRRNEPIDYLTVCEELRHTERLEEVGGAAYVTYLVNHTPPSMYAEAYGRLVERAAKRRRLMAASQEIWQIATNEDIDTPTAIQNAEAAVFAVTSAQSDGDGLTPVCQIVGDVHDDVEHAMTQDVSGIPSGYYDLDRMTGGFQKSDLIIVAGRPAMGKTSLLLSLAENGIRESRILRRRCNVAVFSLEMHKKQVVQRLIAADGGVSVDKQRSGKLDEKEWSRFVVSEGNVSQLSVFVDDTPSITPWTMMAKAKRLHNRIGLDLVIVDYLQLMTVVDYNTRAVNKIPDGNRVQEIGIISRSLKQLARDLDVPVIAAAQLSRAVEGRQDKRPMLSDLRDSGTIEQDADIVMFLYRDDYYNPETERPNQTDIILAKQRNGPTGTVSLYFRPESTKFANMTKTPVDLRKY